MPLPYFEQPHLSLGPISIHAFGALVATAVLVGTEVLRRRSITEKLDALKSQQLVGWVLVVAFIMAHVFDRVVYHPRELMQDPISILKIWASLSSFGGFIGAVMGIFLFLRRHSLKPQTWRYLDAVAYAFVFGWIFGRLGCTVAFDHPGIPTSFFISQYNREGIAIFNLGFLEALYFLPLAAVFYVVGRKRRPQGFFVGLLCLLYVPFRFFADFLRTVDVRYGGLTPGQWGCLVVAVLGVVIMRQALRRGVDAPA